MSLLEILVVLSEKAANIARICRENDNLFQLLIEKKDSGEANPRFNEDFKTLADVLIQETVRYEVGKYVSPYFYWKYLYYLCNFEVPRIERLHKWRRERQTQKQIGRVR